MGEKVYIARQDTLEEVKADTAALKADTTQIKTDTAATKADAGSILARIGLTGDTGGSQSAGTVMGKENAILGALERIYRGYCFRDPTAVEQTTFQANETVPANTTTYTDRLLKTITLTRDFYLTYLNISARRSSGTSDGDVIADFYIEVDGIALPDASGAVYRGSSSSSNNSRFFYNEIYGGWGSTADSNVYRYRDVPSSRLFLFRKGSTLNIYSRSLNRNTALTAEVSVSIAGYEVKI